MQPFSIHNNRTIYSFQSKLGFSYILNVQFKLSLLHYSTTAYRCSEDLGYYILGAGHLVIT